MQDLDPSHQFAFRKQGACRCCDKGNSFLSITQYQALLYDRMAKESLVDRPFFKRNPDSIQMAQAYLFLDSVCVQTRRIKSIGGPGGGIGLDHPAGFVKNDHRIREGGKNGFHLHRLSLNVKTRCNMLDSE